MDFHPIDLVLTVAVAAATIFLGFLPNKSIPSTFFAQVTLKAGLAWLLVAFTSPPEILHVPIIFALLCIVAWRQFRHDNAFRGKMWLNLASGLGISVGVLLMLDVTPLSFPTGLSVSARLFLLASIYLGGTIIGLSYICSVLTKGTGIPFGIAGLLVQRRAGLLMLLVMARAAILLSNFMLPGRATGDAHDILTQAWMLLGLNFIVLPTLAGMAVRATNKRVEVSASSIFIAICLGEILSEILARLLVL